MHNGILTLVGGFRFTSELALVGIGAGTTFQLGKQKSVKNNQDSQIQGITVRNMYYSKKVRTV